MELVDKRNVVSKEKIMGLSFFFLSQLKAIPD